MKHEQANTKTVRTALDDLPYGPMESEEAYGRVGKARTPEGVNKSRMFRDATLIAWPSFIELVLTQLTGMADQIMVGQMPGEAGVQGLSAVGISGLPKFLLLTMIIAMNVGTTAVVARSRGQQDREKANRAFQQAIVLNLLLSTVITVFGLLISRSLITFMGGNGISQGTLDLGVTYLRIQLYGFIPLCLTSTTTAALRGVGDTKTPMVYNTVANVVNIFFNYVMICGKFGCPVMGVAGASWATVIGQTAAFFMAMRVALGKKHYLYLDLKQRFRLDTDIMKNIASIGLPSMIEQFIMRTGFLIFNRTVASLGDAMLATHQVVVNIQSMSFMVGQAFGNASTTLMGQSLGKRRYDMAAMYMKVTRTLGMAVSCVTMVLMALFNEPIIRLYNSAPEVVATGSAILLMVALLQPLQGDQFIMSGGLRGVGDTRYGAMMVLVTTLGVRAVLCVIAVNVFHWGLFGAWVGIVCDQLLRSLLITRRYRSGKWKVHVRRRAEAEAQAASAA
ncbi:MAG: MATE family efflux transporter [Clostridia bacterium]|nr:MATE family efflux transporter [Clostridia bacterium]